MRFGEGGTRDRGVSLRGFARAPRPEVQEQSRQLKVTFTGEGEDQPVGEFGMPCHAQDEPRHISVEGVTSEQGAGLDEHT